MPEGDTIYRAARALDKGLAGRTVTAFQTGVAALAAANDQSPVPGRTVERVDAQGKWCLIHFSGDLILASHMLMSGSWHIYRTGEKWWQPRSRMRVAITCGEIQAVLFNAQIAEFHTARSLARSSRVPRLGPDVLSTGFTAEIGVEALARHTEVYPDDEVGLALLNQRVLAGLGNVYKSEVAFAAGVHPFRRVRTLTRRELESMSDAAVKYMRANVADGTGESIVTYTGHRRTTHNMHAGDRLWVYGRQGQECRRCGAIIESRKQGEEARVTFWCPSCQPWIAAEGQSSEAPVGRALKRVTGRRKTSC